MYLQKDLNLDKLRYAALTGDTATAAAEEERLIKREHEIPKRECFSTTSICSSNRNI